MFLETEARPKGEVGLDRVGAILLRAAEIIEDGGHCKGVASVGDARCLSGAITTASLERFRESGDQWALYHGHNEAFNRLSTLIPFVVAWNDAPERTKEEAVAKLQEAAFVR